MPPRSKMGKRKRSPSSSIDVAANGIAICDVGVEIEHRPPRGYREESERSEREFRVRYVFILSNKKRVKAVSKHKVWELHETGGDPALEMREISVASLKNYNKRAQSDECRVDWEAPGGAFPKLDSIWRFMWGHAQHLMHTRLQGTQKKSKSTKEGRKTKSRREAAMEEDPSFHGGIDLQVPPPQMAGPRPMLNDLDEDDEELGAQIYSQSNTAKRFAAEGKDDLSSANKGSAEIRCKPPRPAKGDTNSRDVARAGPSSSTPGVGSSKCNSLDAPSAEDTCSSFDAKGGKSTRGSSSRTRPRASKVSPRKQGGSEPLKHRTSKDGSRIPSGGVQTGRQTRVTGRKLNKGERSEIWNGYVSAANSYLSYALDRELPPIYEPTEDEIKAAKLIDPLPWFMDRVDKMEERPSLGVVNYWRTKIKNILKIPAHDKSVQDPFDTLAFKRFLNKFQRRTHYEPSNPDEVGTVKCYLTRLMSFRLNEDFSERYPFEKDLVESIKGEEVLAFYREIFDESKEDTTREAVKTATKAIRAKVESYGLKADYLDSEEFDAYYREFETYYMKKKRTKEAEAGS